MSGSRADGTNPRAQGTNPRAEATRRQIDEIERLLRLVCRKLNIDTTPVEAQGSQRSSDGGWHAPGSQPPGTSGVPEPESDPIPGASPATARAMLRKAQEPTEGFSAPDGRDGDGRAGERNTGAVVVSLDSRARAQHPTARKNDNSNDERTN